jgi:hypothetical protein
MKALEEVFNKYHESGAIVLGVEGMGGEGKKLIHEQFLAGIAKAPQAVMEGFYLPFQLYSGAEFNCRFTMQPLKPEEEAQYIAYSAGRLEASDGGIFLADGFGVLEPGREIEDDGFEVVTIDVPRGDYLVTCYGFLPGPIVHNFRGETGRELGQWYMESYGDAPPPYWFLEWEPEVPAETMSLWRGAVEEGPDWTKYLHFVFQLKPFEAWMDFRWSERCFNFRYRPPEKMPLGIKTVASG